MLNVASKMCWPMTRLRGVIAAGAAVLALIPAGAAADDTVASLLRCAGQGDDAQRLACYDKLAARYQGQAASDGGEASGPRVPEAEAEEWFGMESRAASSGLDEVRANVVGGFTGWDGRTQFELDNGQVWVQTTADRFRHTGADLPVVIRRGALGGFLLSPDGLKRSVRVRRVR